VVRDHRIPGPGVGPNSIEPSPDGRIAYLVTNHYKDISGIDLATGEEVFRARMSHAGDERTINLGLTISPDGTRIYSYEIPTRLHVDRYEVLPTRISVYPTDGGLDAEPIKVFNDVPRRIHLLMASPDGENIYALGWDLYTLNAETGEIVNTFGLRNWDLENVTPPDILNFWPMPETSGMFSTFALYMRTDLPEDDPEAFVMGLLTLDLETGEAAIDAIDIEPEVYFTITLGPDRKHAYAGYLGLAKIDMETKAAVKRVDLDHSYYQVNVSKDGSEVYVGGTLCDIAIYATADLERTGTVELPDCPDMAASALRVVTTDLGD